jgi:hypothetical protein
MKLNQYPWQFEGQEFRTNRASAFSKIPVKTIHAVCIKGNP